MTYLKTPSGAVRGYAGIGDVYLSQPRGSVRRYGMSGTPLSQPRGNVRGFAGFGVDGPIISPDQDPSSGEIQMPDDYVGTGFDPNQNQTVATVGPTITGTPSSGATGPGSGTDPNDGWITTYITGTGPQSVVSAAKGQGNLTSYLLLAAIAAGGYYLYKDGQKPTVAPKKAATLVTNPRRKRR